MVPKKSVVSMTVSRYALHVVKGALNPRELNGVPCEVKNTQIKAAGSNSMLAVIFVKPSGVIAKPRMTAVSRRSDQARNAFLSEKITKPESVKINMVSMTITLNLDIEKNSNGTAPATKKMIRYLASLLMELIKDSLMWRRLLLRDCLLNHLC